jgi:hypothetical protein
MMDRPTGLGSCWRGRPVFDSCGLDRIGGRGRRAMFMPPAVFLGLVGAGKLAFDLVQKDFRVATNTLVVLGVAIALAVLGMLADLLVQLNKRRHDVIPAEVGAGWEAL